MPKPMTYASAGVDIETTDAFVGKIQSHLRQTFGPRVINNPGGFAGLFRLDYNQRLFQKNYKDPVLVACCDGVGTKVKLASAMKKYDTVGIDLVAMSVNDLIVQGAEPLFFLDYVAVPRADPEMLEQVVKGVSEACRACGCALLGGETAEMPDVYPDGEFDLAGFAVGVVELRRAMSASRVRPGDVVLGIASSGVHSNGFSLVRKVIEHASLDLNTTYPELHPERSLGEVLLEPTVLYADVVARAQRVYRVKRVISAMAHITGGGLADNLSRVLPPRVDAVVRRGSWEVPAVFSFLQERGGIETAEMERVFNMGVGYCVVVRPSFADATADRIRRAGHGVSRIGEIVSGEGSVRLTD
ncbi:MAG: phosphoribosylformylglycinamidine cyclo-ligase [Planctomycetota bacterium]